MTGTVYITEYASMTGGVFVTPPVVYQPPIVSGNTSTPSVAFGLTTNFVRVAVDTGGAVNIGWNQPATTSLEYWNAGAAEARVVTPGSTLSVISNGAPPPDQILMASCSCPILMVSGGDLLMVS